VVLAAAFPPSAVGLEGEAAGMGQATAHGSVHLEVDTWQFGKHERVAGVAHFASASMTAVGVAR
jgi:hypothetical protein